MENKKIHNLAIVGTGPAGLTASIYASRYGVEHVLIGKLLGGLILESHKVDNYPGIEEITGFELSQKFAAHAKKYQPGLISQFVKKIVKNDDVFELDLEDGEKILAHSILLSAGTERKKLNALGEDKFLGKGISYCATCDGFFYKGKNVAVIGGGDSAATAALYLADIAKKVYLIYRGTALKAEPYWAKLIEQNEKIEVIYQTNVLEIKGEAFVKELILDNEYKGSKSLETEGAFIEIGSEPNFKFAQELNLEMDDSGHIKVNSDCSASVKGVWGAGDITTGSDKFKQVITASAEGAIASRSIFNYLKANGKI